MTNLDLAARLEALNGDDTKALKPKWEAVFGRPPPPRFSADLLRSGIGYRLQEMDQGGPDKGLARRMRRLAKELETTGAIDVGTRPLIKPGTQLLREFGGKTHRVTVVARGFEYEGKTHKSLSGIAREITGTRWSGPAFFGVKGRVE